MATQEIDVISHLLEVEREVSLMLSEAQKKADEKIAHSRAAADLRFKELYSQIVKNLDSEEIAAKEKIESIHKEKLASYQNELESAVKDKDSFCSIIDKVLFA